MVLGAEARITARGIMVTEAMAKEVITTGAIITEVTVIEFTVTGNEEAMVVTITTTVQSILVARQ